MFIFIRVSGYIEIYGKWSITWKYGKQNGNLAYTVVYRDEGSGCHFGDLNKKDYSIWGSIENYYIVLTGLRFTGLGCGDLIPPPRKR